MPISDWLEKNTGLFLTEHRECMGQATGGHQRAIEARLTGILRKSIPEPDGLFPREDGSEDFARGERFSGEANWAPVVSLMLIRSPPPSKTLASGESRSFIKSALTMRLFLMTVE